MGQVDVCDLDDGLPRGFLAGAVVEVWVPRGPRGPDRLANIQLIVYI
jgi:hypothetical protein